MAKNPNEKKQFNDTFKSTKGGSSNSKLDFIKEGTDFLTDVENEEEDSEIILQEDLDDPELSEFDEEIEEEFTIEKEISEEIKIGKTGKITVISRKVPVKKPVENEAVEKEVSKLVKELITDISESEITTFLESTTSQREQFLNGEMQFLSRKNVSLEDKKEFMTKLDEITSTDDVLKANSAFVLNWLKKRNNT